MSWFSNFFPFISQQYQRALSTASVTDTTQKTNTSTVSNNYESRMVAFSVNENENGNQTQNQTPLDEKDLGETSSKTTPTRRLSQRTKSTRYGATEESLKEADEELPPLAQAQRKLLEKTLPDKSRSSSLSWLFSDSNMPPKEDKHARCEWMVSRAASSGDAYDLAFRYLPTYGCPFGRENIMCMPCSGSIHGGYIPGIGVLICENHVDNQATLSRTLTHELIHAFDECRAKIDWSNCEHQACTEIRAATLSGDCDVQAEARRGVPPSFGGFKTCVRRRAILSVSANPNCKGEKAAQAVDKVWNPCHYDVSPFPDLSHSDRQAFKEDKEI